MKTSSPILMNLALACVLAWVLAGCSGTHDELDAAFTEVAQHHIDQVLQQQPEWATNLGEHRYDGEVTDFSESGYAARAATNQATLADLAAIDPELLHPGNRVDYGLLKEQCESALFEITELHEYRWNPTMYNPGDGLYNIIAREYAPLPERTTALKSRLEKLPATLAAARQNLDNPPRVMTETAIKQNEGVINLVMDGLQDYLGEGTSLPAELGPARAAAIAALNDYGQWLRQDLLPRSQGDFRLGNALWAKKLRYSLSSDLSPAEILAGARADLIATRDEMYEVALPLYREFFGGHVDDQGPGKDGVIRRVLERLAEDHPTNENIVARAEAGLADITAFVRRANLVTVPDDPLQIIVMPEHQRGFYIGYCDSPGPLETNGTTFYAISPTPSDWTDARAATFYREYNDYMLRDLTIHEAMPGHYLQIAHANKCQAATQLRAIFSSGTFVEGWATYAEQLMVEAGYGGPEVHLQQLKMHLRLIINAIIDQQIHTAGMSEGEAMEMMMSQGFQEEGEAAGKWVRACLTSTQLSTYYVGNREINSIRRDYTAAHGGRIDLKEFHDRLLSFGSPPPKYVRTLLGL